MKVSVIITGRNDNYGGQFTERLTSTVRYNLEQFAKHGIDCELVFVEWNPPSNRELLAHQVTREHSKATCYVVDNLVHRHICENKHIELFEYYAKNIGAAHAKGDWLLVTNPDIAFGEDTFQFMSSGQADENTLYRASFARIHDLAEMAAAEPIDPTQPPPFQCHAGDFVFCHRGLFDKVGGFREDLPFSNAYKDGIFVHSVYKLCGKAKKIGTVYHMEHERFKQGKRRVDYDWLRVPLTPQSEYGLRDICELQEIAERIYQVSLIEELRAAAREKILPEPVVPRSVRKLPKLVRKFRDNFLRKSA